MRIVVFDLDDTLVAKEITREVNERSYGSSLKKLREMGISVPEGLEAYSYNNLLYMIKEYPLFKEIYLHNYKAYLKQIEEKLKKERNRARGIVDEAIIRYSPEKIYVVTANIAGKIVVDELGLTSMQLVQDVIIVDGSNYVEEKAKVLNEIKKNGGDNAEVIYVADCPVEDGEVARRGGAKFVLVAEFLENLYLPENMHFDPFGSSFSPKKPNSDIFNKNFEIKRDLNG